MDPTILEECPDCGCDSDTIVCTCRTCGDGTEDIPANPDAPYYSEELIPIEKECGS